jgi:Spy/CpxP family protein refolding chaperone
MRKLHKAAVVVAIISGFSLMGTVPATAQAAGGTHGGGCKSHDLNIDILGEVGILNGLGGNLINGEGSPGAQSTDIGSDCGHGW